MAKPSAPLLSFGARGSIAKTAVYSSWRGIPYVRQHVVPANPRTTAQVTIRDVFAWMQAVWKVMPSGLQQIWTAFALGQPFTDRNAWTQKNASPAFNAGDNSALIYSPGVNAGLVMASATPTPSTTTCSMAYVAPTPPAAWTFTNAIAVAQATQVVPGGVNYTIHIAESSTSPISITGLTATQGYIAAVIAVWQKPDGTTAYGPGLQANFTTT